MNCSSAARMLVCVVAVAGAPALAHGKDAVHLKGRIHAVTPTTIEVAPLEGERVLIGLDATTRFERGDATIAAPDLQVGEKVVVHAVKQKAGPPRAVVVKVSAAAPRAGDAGTAHPGP